MIKKTSIHVIEDEEDISRLIQYNLSLEGFDISISNTGEIGLSYIESNMPDLILLDLMLPGIDGMEICKILKTRKDTKNIPIIMVTAKGAEQDIIDGLNMGADDYITKPFSPQMLLARVKNVLRRVNQLELSPEEQEVIKLGELVIHLKKFEVTASGKKIDLTRSEFQILYYLAQHPGWVFTRTQIVDAIRGENYAITSRSIDFQMVGLRKKLGDESFRIETIRGVGYRFSEES